MIDRTLRFIVGPLAIIAVLKVVSGDQHIHVAAPTGLLAVWFIIDIIRYAIDGDNKK